MPKRGNSEEAPAEVSSRSKCSAVSGPMLVQPTHEWD